MNIIYETTTVIWRKSILDTHPTIIPRKGIQMESFHEDTGILNFSPAGTVLFKRESGAVIEKGTTVFKMSIIGTKTDPELFIPHAQFGKALYPSMLVLVADSDKMFPTLRMENFRSSIEEDNILASQRNLESVKWMLFVLRLGKSFSIGEYSFRNHDGVLEKN